MSKKIQWVKPVQSPGRKAAYFGVSVGATHATIRLSTELMTELSWSAGDKVVVGFSGKSLYVAKSNDGGFILSAYVGDGESRKALRGQSVASFLKVPLAEVGLPLQNATWDEVSISEDGVLEVNV